MVERLKSAIEKARSQREGFTHPVAAATSAAVAARVAQSAADDGSAAAVAATAAQPAPQPASAPPRAAQPAARPPVQAGGPLHDWSAFPEIATDEKRLAQERIVTRSKADPAHRAFDMLRTRILRAFREKGWSRLGVTSPSVAAGKTVVSLNLAFSLARQQATRVLLIDMDLAAPRLTSILAPDTDADIRKFLTGETPPESYLRRCGSNLLVGLNRAPIAGSSEILQSGDAARVLSETIARTQPTVVICDLSPVMASDDALNVLANVDCAMLVVAANETRANEITESEKLIGEWTNLLGIVLNKSEERNRDLYGY